MFKVTGVDTTVENFSMEPASAWRERDSVIDWDLSYFEAKTHGVRLPSRADLKPTELTKILPEVALFKPLFAPDGELDDLKILLLGTDLDRFYGAFTGKNVSEHPNPQVFNRIMQASRHTIELREPVVVRAMALSISQVHITITVLYVPMSEDGTAIDRLFVHNRVAYKEMHDIDFD